MNPAFCGTANVAAAPAPSHRWELRRCHGHVDRRHAGEVAGAAEWESMSHDRPHSLGPTPVSRAGALPEPLQAALGVALGLRRYRTGQLRHRAAPEAPEVSRRSPDSCCGSGARGVDRNVTEASTGSGNIATTIGGWPLLPARRPSRSRSRGRLPVS